jgi:hypothetical protein
MGSAGCGSGDSGPATEDSPTEDTATGTHTDETTTGTPTVGGESETYEQDIVVYGGTSAAVTAAVQAGRRGSSVVIVSPKKRVGGMTVGGLGWSDLGDKRIIGGICREFYHRIWTHYQEDDAWEYGSIDDFAGGYRVDDEAELMSLFEPSVAEAIYQEMVSEEDIPVHRDRWLDRDEGVEMDGNRIVSITTLDGTTYRGDVFLDATYEGDLLAAAGVDYTVGREGTDVYGEKWAGVHKDEFDHQHNFQVLDEPVDPYVDPGNPDSGLLPRISDERPGPHGSGDQKVQAYCFRMCLTDVEENRVPFPKPEGYDPGQYELLLRIYDTGWRQTFAKFDDIPNRKTDTNNHGPFSTDNIGFNWEYPEASYERREEIVDEHERYQKGLMYFIANDDRVPDEVQSEMQEWGLAKDEFVDNDHWPDWLYIREARRMVGEYVMTEHNLMGDQAVPKPVGMGAYTMDSHNVQRYVREDGTVENEGDIGVSVSPYQISYESLTPKADQCENLLVPVAVSSSHIAFGSIRMEPVFMILGQSAAMAALLAVERGDAVQDISYDKLRVLLESEDQVLDLN